MRQRYAKQKNFDFKFNIASSQTNNINLNDLTKYGIKTDALKILLECRRYLIVENNINVKEK